jgi:hypothetical protein
MRMKTNASNANDAGENANPLGEAMQIGADMYK